MYKKSPSYSSQSINGNPCSYAKLKTYANCARAEIKPAPAPVAVTSAVAPPVVVKAAESYRF